MAVVKAGFGTLFLVIFLWLGLTPVIVEAQFTPPQVRVVIPPGGVGALRLQPGESGTLIFGVQNLMPHALGTTSIRTRYTGGSAAAHEVTFVPEPGSTCRAIDLVAGALTIDFLDANELVICRTQVTRSLSSLNDLKIAFCQVLCEFPGGVFEDILFLGELPDISLTSDVVYPIAVGATTATVRLIASNTGSRPIASQIVESECVEFGGGVFYPAPFGIENDFPGACPTTTGPLGCGNFGGQNFSSVAFSIGPIPAGGTASCDLRLRFNQPLTTQVDIEMAIRNYAFTHPDGTVGFDANPANNATRMGASPSAPYAYVPVPALRRELLAVIAVLLLAAGAWQTRTLTRHR